MKQSQLILFAAGLLAASAAPANITIPTVPVGDAGNANDSTGFGGVSYDYYIGTYEVTNGQYASFLNSVAATDTHSLYNSLMNDSDIGGINRAGSSGSYSYSVKSGFENKPVNYVSFWDAVRFTNWLTTGGTETGVYVLDAAGITNNTITRDATAWANGGVAIASENEWYKAAYYSGSPTGADGDGYWLYPTQSNTAPTATGPNSTDANSANYGVVAAVTDVGSYTIASSHYGTFDQAANVWELNDAIVSSTNRGFRGGSFGDSDGLQQSSSRLSESPFNEFPFGNVGFRVSSLEPIPEPSAYAAILGCLGLSLAQMRRKGRGISRRS